MGENREKELTLRAKVSKLVDRRSTQYRVSIISDLAEFQVFNRISKDVTIMNESLSRHYCNLEGDPNAIKRVASS